MLIVRPISPTDQPAWLPLWQGYLEFYKATVSAQQTQLTWQRLHQVEHPLQGHVALLEGQVVGFSHSFMHGSTWAEHGYLYLEDLFVVPEQRGQGVARALIEAVAAWGKKQGAQKIYWQTQQHNATARALYDKLASQTEFVLYERVLG